MPKSIRIQPQSLYAPDGARKYVNISERSALLTQLGALPVDRKLFVLMLIWTGARVSEVLALTVGSFQLDRGIVAVRTLKRRRHMVREIPVSARLMAELDRHFLLRRRQTEWRDADEPLWRFKRETAWRFVKQAMRRANIHGVKASPRGLRHAFGIHTLASGMPLNIVQRMLGHSSIATTTIYTEASGPEERAFAERFWLHGGPAGDN